MNYEQMTDNELRHEIAERLGWDHLDWEGDILFGHNPHGTHQLELTPNWPQDANDALELLFPDVDDLEICFHDHTLTVDWFYAHDDERFTTAVEQRSASVARAICICWLRWQDAKGKDES
jgi:hypothetical protein